jgi:hypothetical protein
MIESYLTKKGKQKESLIEENKKSLNDLKESVFFKKETSKLNPHAKIFVPSIGLNPENKSFSLNFHATAIKDINKTPIISAAKRLPFVFKKIGGDKIKILSSIKKRNKKRKTKKGKLKRKTKKEN